MPPCHIVPQSTTRGWPRQAEGCSGRGQWPSPCAQIPGNPWEKEGEPSPHPKALPASIQTTGDPSVCPPTSGFKEPSPGAARAGGLGGQSLSEFSLSPEKKATRGISCALLTNPEQRFASQCSPLLPGASTGKARPKLNIYISIPAGITLW